MKSQRQKKVIGLLTTALLSLTMLAGSFTSVLAADSNGLTLTAQVKLQSDDPADTLPTSVTVRLLADGEETGSAQATDSNGYQVEFDIPLPEKAAPDYSIQIDPIDGYTEDVSQHVNPALTFICPVGGDWTKYEPCNELSIPTNRLSHEIIAAKMTKHGPMIIWTPESMTSTEEQIIVNSVMGNPGVGNPSSIIFVVGNAVTQYGLTINVDEGKVQMDRPSDWSLLFGGEYTKIGTEVLDGQIVLNKVPVTEPPVIDGPLDPPTEDPDTPTVDVPEQIPDVEPEPPIVDTPPEEEPKDPSKEEPEQIPDTEPEPPIVDNPPLADPDMPTVDVPEQIPDVEPEPPIVDTPPEEDPKDPSKEEPEQTPDTEPDQSIGDTPQQDKDTATPEETSQGKAVGRSIPKTGVETDAGVDAAATLLILAAAGLITTLRVRKNKRS